jgi:hypothetical protein
MHGALPGALAVAGAPDLHDLSLSGLPACAVLYPKRTVSGSSDDGFFRTDEFGVNGKRDITAAVEVFRRGRVALREEEFFEQASNQRESPEPISRFFKAFRAEARSCQGIDEFRRCAAFLHRTGELVAEADRIP